MTLIWRMIRALCCGDGAEHRWLDVIDYLVAENRVLREQLGASGRRLRLNNLRSAGPTSALSSLRL